MAVAVDSSTPARVAGVGTGANFAVVVPAAGTFTTPSTSFLVAFVEADSSSTDAFTFTFTNSGTALTWTKQVERTALEATAGGYSGVFTAPMTTGAAISVTATRDATTGGTGRVSVKVYVLTGVDNSGTPVDTVGASNEGGSAATPMTTTSLTPGATGMIFAGATDWSTRGAITSSDLTLDHAEYAGQIDVADGYKACTSGVGVTAGFTAGAASPQFKWVQSIAREAAAVSGGAFKPTYRAFPFAPGGPQPR